MTEAPWFDLAHKKIGVHETPGDSNNPEVLKFFQDAGHPEIHNEDTAWCAAFVGAMLHRAGVAPSGSLMARSYLKWGMRLAAPKRGCIAVLWRGSPNATTGHVGFVVGFTEDSIDLLGGNQGAAGVVSIERFPRSRVLGYRWPNTDGGPDIGPPAVSVGPAPKPKGTTTMNPLPLLTSLVDAVLPATAPGTPSAGVTIAPGAAGTNLLSIALGAMLTGLGGTSFGVDIIHTASTVAGIALALLTAVNHMGLINSSNSNTEALAEQLLKQIADAGVKET
jgi:uncharacterized protein (TIGR02594 family)